MNVDGTQLEYVAVGEISGIHCTSRYTFFSYYEDQSTLYRIPTTAPITTIEEISIKLDIENPIIRINTAFKGCSSLEKISVLPRIYHN